MDEKFIKYYHNQLKICNDFIAIYEARKKQLEVILNEESKDISEGDSKLSSD